LALPALVAPGIARDDPLQSPDPNVHPAIQPNYLAA
jgi:hypothetical protein